MRRFLPLLAAVMLLAASLAPPATATVYRTLDRQYLGDTPSAQKHHLVNPGSLTMGPDGRLAVWDRGLGQFFRLDVGGEGSSTSALVSLMERRTTIRRRRRMGFREDPGAIWDRRGHLWAYDSKAATRAGTVPLRSLNAPDSVRSVPGPVEALQAGETGWFIQSTGGSGRLRRMNVSPDGSSADTLTLDLRGRLVGVAPGPRFYTREGDRVHVYDRSGELASHSFVNLQTVAVDGDRVFVLAGDNRIVEADDRLAVQFTYYFARSRSFRDLAVHERTAYLAGEGGLYRSPLDNTRGSFFSSSATLDLEMLAGPLPDRYDRKYAHRIRLVGGGTSPRLSLPIPGERVLEADFNGRRLSPADSPRPRSEAPLGRFYRPGGATGYQGRRGHFYYYFPDRGLVESYDTAAENRRRTRLDFDSFDFVEDVAFLGANADRILFRGRVMDPELGLRRALLVFDWQGEPRRVVHMHPPEGRDRLAGDTRPARWRYDGHDRIYVLHEQHLQAYDLQGYPAGTLTGVTRPQDVVRRGEHLYVLDLQGWRLSVYRRESVRGTRYGSPPDYPRVSGIAPVDDGRSVLSARTRPGSPHRLLEYDERTRSYQVVLEHPRRTLRFPVSDPGGDTLFFWGRSGSDRPWTLFQSDLRRFAAQSTGQQARLRGPGFYSERHRMLMVPVETRSGTAPRYRYLYPGRGQAPLEGSSRLEHLTPGGFVGFYGVRRLDSKDALVTGYLASPSDTAGWHWIASDTLLVSPDPIRSLRARGRRVYISTEPRPGFTRVGSYEVPSSGASRRGVDDLGSVRWLHQSRGRLRWGRAKRSEPVRLLHRPSRTRGYLADLYSPSTLRTGGLQGGLHSRAPVDLAEVPLRLDPGGQLMETDSGGRFSRAGVPEGYVRILTRSHRHHLATRDWLAVKPGEYTEPSSVPIETGEELVLLERGLSYYREDRYRRARISLKAFLELVEEGPSRRWAGALLETLYWKEGDVESLVELYRQRPALFSPSERLRLLSEPGAAPIRPDLYRRIDPGWDSVDRRVMNYLRARSTLEKGDEAPVPPAVLLGPAARGLPVLRGNS